MPYDLNGVPLTEDQYIQAHINVGDKPTATGAAQGITLAPIGQVISNSTIGQRFSHLGSAIGTGVAKNSEKYPAFGQFVSAYNKLFDMSGVPVGMQGAFAAPLKGGKFGSFADMGKALKEAEAREKMATSANTRKGQRNRTMKAKENTEEAIYTKAYVDPRSVNPQPVEPRIEPFNYVYPKEGGPTSIKPMLQREPMTKRQKRFAIERAKKEVESQWRRNASQKGENVPAWQQQAIMRAIENDPKANAAPPTGTNKPTYRYGYNQQTGQAAMDTTSPLAGSSLVEERDAGFFENAYTPKTAKRGHPFMWQQAQADLEAATDIDNNIGGFVKPLNSEGNTSFHSDVAMAKLREGLQKAAQILK